MKQKIIIVVAVICAICVLIATIVSVQRAKTLPKQPEQESGSEIDSDTGSEIDSEIGSETGTQEPAESQTQEPDEQQTAAPADIGGMPYVEYTGEKHPGTGIAYRGSGEMAQYVIVIDAGHQLHAMSETEPNGPGSEQMKAKVTGGTQGSFTGLAEYELNLRVALALRDVLVAKGYTVVMVRETHEVEISNAERAQLANRAGADVNIRIHANGDANASAKGAMAVCQTPQNPYNANIYEDCRALSDAVLDAFCLSTGMAKRNVWQTDTMTGTNWASVPTTIIEMGFMTNAEDDAAMAAEGFAAKAADGLVQGIGAYLAQKAPSTEDTSKEQETTEPEQETYPDSKYDINFQREAELGQSFTDVETTVEFTGTAWIRTEPSTKGGDATKVQNIRTYAGKRVTCIGLGENWHRLLIDGKVYYASAAYLKVVEE